MAEYSYFDHTADVGIEFRGSDERELFETGAQALIALVLDPAGVSVDAHRTVSIRTDGIDLEDLLVNWLREVLWTAQTPGFAAKSARVTRIASDVVVGEVLGEAFDASRHERRDELKGVTRHGVSVERKPDGLGARVVVDV